MPIGTVTRLSRRTNNLILSLDGGGKEVALARSGMKDYKDPIGVRFFYLVAKSYTRSDLAHRYKSFGKNPEVPSEYRLVLNHSGSGEFLFLGENLYSETIFVETNATDFSWGKRELCEMDYVYVNGVMVPLDSTQLDIPAGIVVEGDFRPKETGDVYSSAGTLLQFAGAIPESAYRMQLETLINGKLVEIQGME